MNQSPSYEDLMKALSDLPLTWYPAVLIKVVQECAKRPVFKGEVSMLSVARKAWKQAIGQRCGEIG